MKDIISRLEEARGPKKKSAPELREPYYTMSDGIMGLEDVAQYDLKDDKVLKRLVDKLSDCAADLVKHMHKHYNWD